MKKKLFIFIGLITLLLSFMLIKPQTKAQVLYNDYNAMVVSWDDEDYAVITVFDDGETFTKSYYKYQVMDTTLESILLGYEFQVGIKIYTTYVDNRDITGYIVPDDSVYQDETSLIDGFQYRYIKTEGSYHYFMRDMSIYKVPLSFISFNNSIGGLIEFTTTTKPDNIYIFNDTLNAMYFYNSRDYQYALGSRLAAQDITNAYYQGKDVGYNEGLIDGYENGKSEGLDDGYSNGYGEGYDDGFNQAINELADSSQYEVGYKKGYDDGVHDEVSKNSKNFYDGIAKWLVPSIIVILVFSVIITFKKRDNGIE